MYNQLWRWPSHADVSTSSCTSRAATASRSDDGGQQYPSEHLLQAVDDDTIPRWTSQSRVSLPLSENSAIEGFHPVLQCMLSNIHFFVKKQEV